MFETNLSVDEVRRRLKERVVPPMMFFRSRLEAPIAGSVYEDSCVLFARPSAFARQGFRRVLDLRFETTEQGTVLRGRFRLQRVTMLELGSLSGLMVVAFFRLVSDGILHQRLLSDFDSGALVPLVFIGLVFGMAKLGVWWGSRSEAAVSAFLQDVLVPEVGVISSGVLIRPRRLTLG